MTVARRQCEWSWKTAAKIDICVNSPMFSSSFGRRFGTVRQGHYTWRVDSYIFLLFSYSFWFILIRSCEILGRTE